jgi:Double-GTPase 2
VKALFAGTRLYCPYCYSGFSEREIWFRCSGRIGPKGERCSPEIDPVRRDRSGFGQVLPPVFDSDGRLRAANCPTCGAESTTRICPACHMQLPVHFGKVRSRMIALVGAKESGKTVYMTVLVHELMHRMGEDLNAAISGADDETRLRFASDYEQPLYRDARLLASTTTAGTRDRAPLVFRFTTEGRSSRLNRNGTGEPQRTLLSFFDTAGEDLRSVRSVEENVQYLAAADGIVLLLDPLQMRGARQLAAPGTLLPTPGAVGDEPANVLENITDLIMAKERIKASQRIGKPLAIVFTKMDALLHDLKETSPLLRPPAHTPYFDERDSREVHTEIQRLLARWEGSRIDQIAQKNYRTYRYFGVSALGETPTQQNRVSPRGIRPYRVTGPFTWMLAQFGTIPLERG